MHLKRLISFKLSNKGKENVGYEYMDGDEKFIRK